MNVEPDRPGCSEADLAAAQVRIRQLEQELKAASSVIEEQDFNIECLRLQLEAADQMLNEAAQARRRLEMRIADLEDEDADPCPVIVPVSQEQAPPQQPGYPPGCTPNPVVEAMIGQFRSRERK